MSLTANKGEWSEFYAFLKLLTDPRLHAADEHLNRLADIFYPIVTVIAGKDTADEVTYKIQPEDDTVEITVLASGKTYTASLSELRSKVDTIFNKIKSTSQRTFSIAEAQEIIDQLHIKRVQAGSTKKADIFVEAHDYTTGIASEIGFSIKSKVGAASTLLNASKATNFTFKITGFPGDPLAINKIDGDLRIKRRIEHIQNNGGKLTFHSVNNDVFDSNLRKIDSLMPEMIASLLVPYYKGEGSKLSEACESAVTQKTIIDPSFYPHKIKDLLQTVALGMMPSRPWDGVLEVSGGYIIVKQDGEIVCYHIYNLEQFRNYLFDTTRFEMASTTRHNFGSVYVKDDEAFLNLNLQIRFRA